MVRMSNTIIAWLAAGDLRTDGSANEVAALVAANPDLLPNLIEALHSPQDAIRGRAADALEKVARTQGETVLPYLDQIIDRGRRDGVPMVRWHVAMILGHVNPPAGEQQEQIRRALTLMLADPSAITRSWVIVSLCLLARRRPDWAEAIIEVVQPLEADESKAVRTRVRTALACLFDPEAALPAGWVKREDTTQLH